MRGKSVEWMSLAALLALALYGCGGSGAPSVAARFQVTNQVSDQAGAPITDTNLVNPWGLAIGPTGGAFWVADNGTGVASLYAGDVAGSTLTKNALVVTIPGGSPTGQVFNSSSDFVVSSGGASGPAVFIFASEAGTITRSWLQCSLRLTNEPRSSIWAGTSRIQVG